MSKMSAIMHGELKRKVEREKKYGELSKSERVKHEKQKRLYE